MTSVVATYPTPVVNTGYQPDPGNLGELFPTIMPRPEVIVYDTINDACQSRAYFPATGEGLPFPILFSAPPISLYRGKDGTYTVPAGPHAGEPIPDIPVSRGWPAYPGKVPSIGVVETTGTEDPQQRTTQAGLAGDVYAVDVNGSIVATCAYYAEPLEWTIVVELVHENRDERDRLHDQLWRTLLPLRRVIGDSSEQVWDVSVGGEKQDLPIDDQPRLMYVSVFTVQVSGEALIPTEVTLPGVIETIAVTVTPTTITPPDAQESDFT